MNYYINGHKSKPNFRQTTHNVVLRLTQPLAKIKTKHAVPDVVVDFYKKLESEKASVGFRAVLRYRLETKHVALTGITGQNQTDSPKPTFQPSTSTQPHT